MTIHTINKSTSWSGADNYPVGFYSAHEIVMPEEGWINKVGGVCASDTGGTFKFFITTQTVPGTGSADQVLLWAGTVTQTIAAGNGGGLTFEEDAPNIHVISGQKLFMCMYCASGEARFCYEPFSGGYIYDGPYGGGPTPPTIPLADFSVYDGNRYAQWIEYDDTDPGGGGGKIKVWNGSSWVEKPVKVWNGSSWVEKPVKVWNGSSWVLS